MLAHVKHPRTFHFPWSEGITSDDKMLSSLSPFIGKRVIGTIKMDGENTTMYNDYFHARSLDSVHHPSRDWVKSFWAQIRSDIPDEFRVCGENVFAQHSIKYTDLETYFYGFSVWDKMVCLDWDSVMEWFALLGITPVQVIYDDIFDEKKIRKLWDESQHDTMEGYVVRVADAITYDQYQTQVGKFVRPKHVTTANHWMSQQVVPNLLKK
jgi:hypothetical protein